MEVQELYSDLPRLETPRAILRKITLDDTQDEFTLASDPEVSKYMDWEPHKSLEDSGTFILSILDSYKNGRSSPWAIQHKQSQRMIGTFIYSTWVPRYRVASRILTWKIT